MEIAALFEHPQRRSKGLQPLLPPKTPRLPVLAAAQVHHLADEDVVAAHQMAVDQAAVEGDDGVGQSLVAGEKVDL